MNERYGPWGLTGTCTSNIGWATCTITGANIKNGVFAPTAVQIRDYRINAKYQNDPQGRTGPYNFARKHPGGAQFVYADGNVRFISQTVDYASYCAALYIQDGKQASTD